MTQHLLKARWGHACRQACLQLWSVGREQGFITDQELVAEHTAAIISNLQYMMEHPEAKDAHNAPVFVECYRRMGQIIPELVDRGLQPRVMLDYSGCLLHGLGQMGMDDVFDDLRRITCEPAYRHCVEWLGSAWGHPVAPSTPVQDYRLHVRAWQHHFAGIFDLKALTRVRGFSPAEMALPNHPDVCYEFIRTLKECGYRWLLVQEHTVEQPEDGHGIRQPHLLHRLVARNSHGQSVSIIAIIKTQGSDTKLVGQMQPYYEARGLPRAMLAGKSLPPLVTQIADGENGGVMMNEFPPKYQQVTAEASGGDTPAVNVTEYLEYLDQLGLRDEDFPAIQPILQKQIWDRFEDGAGPGALAQTIEELKKEDGRFHMDGGSWTNNLSWVRGYEQLLGPMERASALFAERCVPVSDERYRHALFHLLASQTSCFRYWGEGVWTDYAGSCAADSVASSTRDREHGVHGEASSDLQGSKESLERLGLAYQQRKAACLLSRMASSIILSAARPGSAKRSSRTQRCCWTCRSRPHRLAPATRQRDGSSRRRQRA